MQSRLVWMKSLESLVLIKLGPYATFDAGERVISLWFHLGRTLPEASDEDVPAIHYHQMVNPIPFVMPRF